MRYTSSHDSLPVYFEDAPIEPNAKVMLLLSEPQYFIMCDRLCQKAQAKLLYTCGPPAAGGDAVVIRVISVTPQRDGSKLVRGRSMWRTVLQDVWVEEGTGPLYYAQPAPAPEVEPPASEEESRACVIS